MRPHNNNEASDAMHRMLKCKEFESVLKFVFPNMSVDQSKKNLADVGSIEDFQYKFSKYAVAEILNKTSSGFSYSGINNIDCNTPYLFISNHRDIVLDSAILQYVLITNGHKSTQITFGSNLMSSQFVIDMGKINRMFTFFRGGSRNDIYNNALIHSAYIKNAITNERQSVWIAQRDGRTKDGNDKTQISLLKMLTIKEKDPVTAIRNLNIVPLSIFYEIEPCDIFKARESILSDKQKYIKTENEDFISVLTGITQYKGKIHLTIGKPLNDFIDNNLSALNRNNVHKEMCDVIDSQIYNGYELTKWNYISYDICNSSSIFFDKKYSHEDKKMMSDMFDEKVKKINDVEAPLLKDRLIKMYAMPVYNAIDYLTDN